MDDIAMEDINSIMEFSAIESLSVPDRPGVYGFFLRFGKLPAASNSAKTQVRLLRLIQLQSHIRFEKRFVGRIYDENVSSLLQSPINLKGSSDAAYVDKLLDTIKNSCDLEMTTLMSKIITGLLPPIYVGMAVEQSLRDRYLQHYENYRLRIDNTFGMRCRDCGVAWNDLELRGIAVLGNISKTTKSNIELCEKIWQFLAKPPLSQS